MTQKTPQIFFLTHVIEKTALSGFVKTFGWRAYFLYWPVWHHCHFEQLWNKINDFSVFCILLVIKNALISYISLSRLVMVPFRSLKKTNWLYLKLRDIRTGIKCQKRPTSARPDAAPGAHFKKLGIGVDIFILTYPWILLVGLVGQWHIA